MANDDDEQDRAACWCQRRDEHDDDDNCDDGGDCKVSQPEKKQLQRVESELDIKILSDEDRKCRMEGFKNNYGGAFQSHSHIDRFSPAARVLCLFCSLAIAIKFE